MSSLFGYLFSSLGSPSLLRTFGDDTTELVYRIGDTELVVKGIVRHEGVETRIDPTGKNLKVRTTSVVVTTDASLPEWSGIETPQLTATWIIRKAGKPDTKWAVDTEPGRGIEALTESKSIVHLIYQGVITQSHPGMYR